MCELRIIIFFWCRLQPNSASLQIGFEPISVENVGPKVVAHHNLHLLKQETFDRIAPLKGAVVFGKSQQ